MAKKLIKNKHKTISEEVFDKLEDLIVFCEIEPGMILTEAEIAEMVGAGRTPVREALRMLANESLVNISRIGVMIPEMSGSTQLQLLEVRRAILKLCVECAVKRLTHIDKKAMQELIDVVDEQEDVDFLHWLKQRHKVLAKASKNQFIYGELRNVQSISHRFWYYYAKKDDHKIGKSLHKNILIAVVNEDLEKSLECVDELIDYLVDFVKVHSI